MQGSFMSVVLCLALLADDGQAIAVRAAWTEVKTANHWLSATGGATTDRDGPTVRFAIQNMLPRKLDADTLIDGVWVYKNGAEKTRTVIHVRKVYQSESGLAITFAGAGPSWPPGTPIDIVVRLKIEGRLYLLKPTNKCVVEDNTKGSP